MAGIDAVRIDGRVALVAGGGQGSGLVRSEDRAEPTEFDAVSG